MDIKKQLYPAEQRLGQHFFGKYFQEVMDISESIIRCTDKEEKKKLRGHLFWCAKAKHIRIELVDNEPVFRVREKEVIVMEYAVGDMPAIRPIVNDVPLKYNRETDEFIFDGSVRAV